MLDVAKIVDDYVAVWNEADPERRRQCIAAVWAPDGTTCYRLLDAHGYEAIETRVRGSWDKWIREGNYIFRPARIRHHHGTVRLEFELVTVPERQVEARGLCFLLLDADGRIRHDYQFNPTANDATDLLQRYVGALSEPAVEARRQRLAELWAPEAELVSESGSVRGLDAIEAEMAAAQARLAAAGLRLVPGDRSQSHHHLARLQWQVRRDGSDEVATATSDLLILDERGRIRLGYRFAEPV